jgi:Fe-S-cluster-containing hydrogenase component 2
MVAPEISVCQDCGLCELVCATAHDGACGPTLRRLWLKRNPFISEYIVLTCPQCQAPSCMAACPVDAIFIDSKTGARCIDAAKCTGCKDCIEACPLDPPRINFDDVKDVAIKCDLCKDRADGPACVQYCPTMCLELKKS